MPSLSKRNQPSSGDDFEPFSTSSSCPVCESSKAVGILLRQIALSHISELTEDEAGSELEYKDDDKSEVDDESMKSADDCESIVEVKEPKQVVKKPVKPVKPTHAKCSMNEEMVDESDDDDDGELIMDTLNDLTHGLSF